MKKLFLLIIVCFGSSCDNILLRNEDQIISIEENLKPPAATDDGWEVSSLASQNIDASRIENLVRNIQKDPGNLHSVLIIRNNRLVLESYFNGWSRDRLHDLRSASKSVNSILVGIAIDKNYIADVHQTVLDFFPEYESFRNELKDKIEIEHVLTMTSGLKWNQSTYPNEDDRNDEGVMERGDNWLRYVLSRDMAQTPGKTFVYNSGCSVLLAGIIKKSTGDHADVFAEKHLFNPLGITNYFWRKQSDGLCNAAWGLSLRPRDMAKIGQLFLDNGKWKGNQVISADWVSASTTTFPGTERDNDGYGYQWWTTKYTINNVERWTFSAAGNGGQYIFVIPDMNAVVVFTGGNYAPRNQHQPFVFLRNIILPAML